MDPPFSCEWITYETGAAEPGNKELCTFMLCYHAALCIVCNTKHGKHHNHRQITPFTVNGYNIYTRVKSDTESELLGVTYNIYRVTTFLGPQ